MQHPAKSGPQLIEEINQTLSVTPALWWLGHAGFVVRFANITFYVDPCLSDPAGKTRRVTAPLAASAIRNADMIFATHGHPGHLDAPSIVPMLETCRGAKLVLPKSFADAANAAGIPYNRMTTTDSGAAHRVLQGQPVWTGICGSLSASAARLDRGGRISIPGLPDPFRALDHLSRR